MDIKLAFVIEKGTTTAHALVTGVPAGKKGGRSEVWVLFRVDGKPKNPVLIEKSLASLELKGLKPGPHTVKAEIVGDGASDEGEVVVGTKTVGWLGGFIMVLYWTGVLYYGYTGYTLTALTVVLLVFFGRTAYQHRHGATDKELLVTFLGKLGNNNWVFRTAFWMLLVTMFLWWVDPTAPEATLNPMKALWNSAKGLISQPLEDPLGEIGFWATINQFFFGGKAMGWGIILFHLWATFWAIPVSYWDEVKDGVKKTGEKGASSSIAKLFGHHLAGEIVTQPLEWAWAILKAPFRK